MNGKLQSRRFWLAGGGVAALLLALASYFLLVSPTLDDAAALRQQTAGVDQQNTLAEASNAQLARKFPHLRQMQAELATLLDAVPATSALPEFTRQTNTHARAEGVVVQSLTITAPIAYQATGTTGTTGTTTDSSATSGAGASTPQTTGAAAPATVSQYQISVTIAAAGSSEHLVRFLHAVQNGSRDILVSNAVFAGTPNKATLSMQAMIFTAPMTPQQVDQTRELLKSPS